MHLLKQKDKRNVYLELMAIVKRYVTETKLKKEHTFCSMVMQKNILTEFVDFLKSDDVTEEVISFGNLENFKEKILEPEMDYEKKKAKEVGIPFDLYQDLLPLPVMNLKMINRYMNDIKMFIDWYHSAKIQ